MAKVKKEVAPDNMPDGIEKIEIVEVDMTKENAIETNNDKMPIEQTGMQYDPTYSVPAEKEAAPAPAEKVEPEQNAVIEEAQPGEKLAEEDSNSMPLAPKETAKFIVGLINMGMCAGIPKLNLAVEFNEVERAAIDKIIAGVELEATEANFKLQQRYMKYVNSLEAIPLNSDETKILTKSWEKCLEKWNFKMTPETALITSTAMIVGGRLLPAIGAKLGKMLS